MFGVKYQLYGVVSVWVTLTPDGRRRRPVAYTPATPVIIIENEITIAENILFFVLFLINSISLFSFLIDVHIF